MSITSCQKGQFGTQSTWRSLLLLFLLGSQSTVTWEPAIASSKHKSHSKPAVSTSNEDSDQLGLPANILTMINRGKWTDAATALEPLVENSQSAGKPEAWLAFAYMYINSCDKLKSLNDKLGAIPSGEPAKKEAKGAATSSLSSASQTPPPNTPNTTAAAAGAGGGGGNNAVDSSASLSSGTSSTATSATPTSATPTSATTTSATTASGPTASSTTASGTAASGNAASSAATSNTPANAPANTPTPITAASNAPNTATPVGADKKTAASTAHSGSATTAPGAAPASQQPAPVNLPPVRSGSTRYALLISAYEKVCESRLPEAAALLKRLPPDTVRDPVCLFARAAIAGKQNRPVDAVNFCQTAVTIAPQFGWGFRTVGFLQERLLKQPQLAEDSYAQALVAEPDLDDARERLIELKLLRNDFDDAIDIAKDAITLHPKDAANYFRLADVYTRQWRFREAEGQLDLAIKYDTNNAKYYRARAAVKKLRGDLVAAIADQRTAVDLSNEKAFEFVELANLEELAGNPNRAADELEEALKTDPNNQLAHEKLIGILEREKRYDELASELNKLVAKAPNEARLHMRLAQVLVASDKIPDAEKEFVKAANLDPTDPEPHRQMGALKIKMKEYSAAAKEYTRALNIKPMSVPDLVSLGYCYAVDDDYMQSEAAFVTALALQQLIVQPPGTVPDRLDVMRSLASLLLQEKRYSDAASQFESILAMSKPGSDSHLDQFMLNRAKALRDLTPTTATALMDSYNKLDEIQKQQQALHLVDTMARMQKSHLAKEIVAKRVPASVVSDADAEWVLAAARYDFSLGSHESANKQLEKILAVKDVAPALKAEALGMRADYELKSDQLEKAATDARAAIDAYSKNSTNYVVAGQIALKQKDYKLAEEFGKKALEQNPYDSSAYLLLGRTKLMTDDTKSAVTNFRKAEELYPALLEPHKLLSETLPKIAANDEAKKESEQLANLEKQQR